ncbi:MAG: hypothetical protein QM703_25235 [Gemmatales bacterium]
MYDLFDKWEETLLSGHVELPLTQLTISKSGKDYKGSGRLVWTDHSSIRITGITDGGKSLINENGRFPTCGTLIPHNTYAKGKGVLQDESEVEIFPVHSPSHQLFEGQDQVGWDYNTHGFVITRKRKHYFAKDYVRTVHLIMQPKFGRWTRGTTTVVDNPIFGTKRSALDWCQTMTRLGLLAFRKLDDTWMEAALFMTEAHRDIELIDISTAIGRTVGFINGKRSRIIGAVEYTGDTEKYVMDVRVKSVSSNSLVQPLGNNFASYDYLEQLLSSTFDLFSTSLGKDIGLHLYTCWDIVDNSYQSKAAVLSICLESLVRMVHSVLSKQQDDLQTPGKDMAMTWLESVKDTIDSGFYKRMKGFLGTMHHMRPIDVLKEWKNTGFLGTTAADIDAWTDIRNAAAHGRMITRNESGSKLQVTVSSLHAINNMINRIVLYLANYNGNYCDASKHGWPDMPFSYSLVPGSSSTPSTVAVG